jgi:hypothetical protein
LRSSACCRCSFFERCHCGGAARCALRDSAGWRRCAPGVLAALLRCKADAHLSRFRHVCMRVCQLQGASVGCQRGGKPRWHAAVLCRYPT